VKEFAEYYSFGCSISTPEFIQLALLDHLEDCNKVKEAWPRMAVYYAMIVPRSRGSVSAIPGFNDSLVRFGIGPQDLDALAVALKRLGEALLAAGAIALYPTVKGLAVARSKEDVAGWPAKFAGGQANLMTIHLFSSCPMGERKSNCVVDSFGRVNDQRGLYVADASVLCSAPGVNPQGSVMAFARRNALQFLGKA
jgi:choline dehydrogenase-like flavoprotein